MKVIVHATSLLQGTIYVDELNALLAPKLAGLCQIGL
jgi:hypothetical protein